MHKHLARQLRRLHLEEATPPSLSDWREFLCLIGATYGNTDRERYMVEHSIEISSREMQELTARIAEERDKFASIFKAAPNGLAICSPEGVLVEVNEALTAMVGYSREELIGRPAVEFVDPADQEVVQNRVEDLANSEIATSRNTRRLRTKSGETVFADIQARTVPGSQTHGKMIITVVEDITERVQLEIELRQAQKLESVGRLAAGIAHEINTPIQFVGDNVTFLTTAFEQLLALCEVYRMLCERAAARPLSKEDIEEQRCAEDLADLEYIRENVPTSIASTVDGVGRVARIVQSMKAFAHPDRGERTVADINNALHNTLTVATNELKYVAKVKTDYGDIPLIPCFLSDLNQVFLNLLVNAAHAIGDVVGKSGERGTIGVRTYQEEGHVVVAISDTGTGIPVSCRSKIFDPFFTTKGVGKGTGQGLALARSVVVDRHGGTITFDTEVGRGTTFYVRIPVTVPDNLPSVSADVSVAKGTQ